MTVVTIASKVAALDRLPGLNGLEGRGGGFTPGKKVVGTEGGESVSDASPGPPIEAEVWSGPISVGSSEISSELTAETDVWSGLFSVELSETSPGPAVEVRAGPLSVGLMEISPELDCETTVRSGLVDDVLTAVISLEDS